MDEFVDFCHYEEGLNISWNTLGQTISIGTTVDEQSYVLSLPFHEAALALKNYLIKSGVSNVQSNHQGESKD